MYVLIRIAPLALAFDLVGCVSWLESEKAATNVQGIRYSLPQPFLLVTPKPDGTVDVETLMLPDSTRTYVIRQPSFIASHTLNVELEHRMLKSVDLNADTSVVGAKAIEGYGAIREAAIKTDAATSKAVTEKAAAAKKRVDDAELAVAKAQAVVDYLTPRKDEAGVAPELLKAQIALYQAQAELDAAKGAATEMGLDGFNIAKEGETPPAVTAYGPVLYRIEQARKTCTAPCEPFAIKLVAVTFDGGATQKEFLTSSVALPPEEKPAEFAFDPPRKILTAKENRFVVTTTLPVKDFNRSASQIAKTDDPAHPVILKDQPTVGFSANGRTLEIGIPSNLKTGEYTFVLPLKIGDAKDFVDKEIKVYRQ